MSALSNTAPMPKRTAAQPATGKQYAKTIATLRKQTVNCAVYNSRALGSTYIPMVNFPEGEDVPERIEITITKA